MLVLPLLASFFLSAAQHSGPAPVVLSGDLQADWRAHAATAEACAVDEMPPENIRSCWRRQGVKLYQRVAWDPECSAEYFRRKIGFLAVRDEADGVWLVGEEKFPDSWKRAVAEARVDVEVVRYCKSLAEKALTWREKDHKVWIEGRRVMWLLKFMNFEAENLDTLRLEFVCYAKRLEQLLGEPPKDLPTVAAMPFGTDRAPFVPLSGRSPVAVAASLDGGKKVALGNGLSFACGAKGFSFEIVSASGRKADGWPGGRGTLRLYLPGKDGDWLPYEFRLDLSPVATNRAPTDAYGLWFLKERWGRGQLHLYDDHQTWRLRPVAYGTYGTAYPHLHPDFDFQWNEKGGWRLKLSFRWSSLYGHWPSIRNGAVDHWYVSLDGLGVAPVACRIDWAHGREQNFRKIAAEISCASMFGRSDAQRRQVFGAYRLWHDERLYGFAKTDKPTFQRGDPESDTVFWERLVQPMLDEVKPIADLIRVDKDKEGASLPAKLTKESDAVRLSVWKSLGKLYGLAERVSEARRDYLTLRLAGKMPPEPPKALSAKGARTKPAVKAAPGLEDGDLQLDDEEP